MTSMVIVVIVLKDEADWDDMMNQSPLPTRVVGMWEEHMIRKQDTRGGTTRKHIYRVGMYQKRYRKSLINEEMQAKLRTSKRLRKNNTVWLKQN